MERQCTTAFALRRLFLIIKKLRTEDFTILGCFDSQFYLIPTNRYNTYCDIFTDYDSVLFEVARDTQHAFNSLCNKLNRFPIFLIGLQVLDQFFQLRVIRFLLKFAQILY